MNIFGEKSYVEILKKTIEERKRLDSKFHFQALAEATRIPKSYVSKVIGGKAHLNADQLFLVCRELRFTDVQTRFVQLLLEWERSSLKDRKEALAQEIRTMREQAQDSRAHLKADTGSLDEQGLQEFYLDPFNQLVHICLSIARYQTDPMLLARDLGIAPEEFRAIIERLERWGVIEQSKGRYATVVKAVHLPRSSPAYKAWRSQLKLLCMERLGHRPQKGDYSFSVTFSATEGLKDRIRAEFMELLKRVETDVREAKAEDTYQMSFDLFSWTSPVQ